MVGKTFTRLVFWSRLLFSSPVLFKEDKDQRTGERERADVQWSITIESTSVPLFIQGGFLIENQQTNRQTQYTHRQTKGGAFLLSAGCVAWSVGRRMAGWRAPGWLVAAARTPLKESGLIN